MSIENLLKYLEAILLMLPLIEQIVQLIEGIFEKLGSGSSEDKKEAALIMARKMAIGKGIQIPDEILSEVIDLAVANKNRSGEFRK